MSEEEQLRLALAASLSGTEEAKADLEVTSPVDPIAAIKGRVWDEPTNGNTTRIQLRFPGLAPHPKLKKLLLMDNKITSLAFFETTPFPELKHLDVSNNRIADIKELKSLKTLKGLARLNLMENKVCNTKGFRDEVFKLFPGLMALDGTTKDGDEIAESDDEEGEEDEDEDDYESDEDGEEGAEDDEEDGADEDEDEDGEDEVGDDDGPGLKFLIENADDDDDDADYEETDKGKRKKATESKNAVKKTKP
ncbi:hypothetical protein HDU96_007125 [Phlyctochytrium bullatum]|nr:hypothetical protein HDU96_007125 [Phlyctochytrium bullatum]